MSRCIWPPGGLRPIVLATLLLAAFLAPAATRTEGAARADDEPVPANGPSAAPSISADGRSVAFASLASNLIEGDTNGAADTFLRDRVGGGTIRISVSSSGEQGNGPSLGPSISADGNRVAFFSYASNLVEGDTNRAPDVFVYDFDAGVTARASLDSLGRQGSGSSVSPSLSADGRYLAFASDSSSGVAGRGEIFVHDLATGQTALVSVSSAGQRVGDTALFPSISADGRYVAFASPASNLAPGDANNTWDVFLHDLATGATERVSVDSSETENAHPSYLPSISSDGSYVAFESAANFDRRDRNGSWDIYVRDLKRGDTAWVSDGHNHPNSGDSHAPAISADGAVVAFASGAALWMEDTNGVADIYQFRQAIAPGPWTDPRSGLTVGIYYGFGPNERLSESVSDGPANGTSAAPAISADGAVVAFSSAASDLVVGDANGAADVFVHLWEGPDFGGGCLAELISAPMAAVATVPQHALQVLDYIDRHGRPPPGYKGGGHFENDGRGGTEILPRFEPDGTPITYIEWDVHPHRPGVDRGMERLLTGTDQSARYTYVHYYRFTRIR